MHSRFLSTCLPKHRFPPFYDENPIGIYQKILAGKLDIPRHVDSKAKDIIKRLLTIDRTSRLGKTTFYCITEVAVRSYLHGKGATGSSTAMHSMFCTRLQMNKLSTIDRYPLFNGVEIPTQWPGWLNHA